MDYITKEDTIIFSHYFNEELLSNFNQKVDLPHNLTHLTFNNHFNQKVDLPPNLTYLTFGYEFNQEVDLPHNLTHLTFGLPRKLFIIFWSLTKL